MTLRLFTLFFAFLTLRPENDLTHDDKRHENAAYNTQRDEPNKIICDLRKQGGLGQLAAKLPARRLV